MTGKPEFGRIVKLCRTEPSQVNGDKQAKRTQSMRKKDNKYIRED